MESRYGIGVNNRYALFLDSDNEDGDNIEDMMAKKTSISGDNQKKTALKDSQGKTKDDKKESNGKVANNKDSSKPNNREGKISNPNILRPGNWIDYLTHAYDDFIIKNGPI